MKIAKRNGITADEVARVIDGSSASGWNKHDRAVLRAMEELHADSMVSDRTWADLRGFCNDKKLIELLIWLDNTRPLHTTKTVWAYPFRRATWGCLRAK